MHLICLIYLQGAIDITGAPTGYQGTLHMPAAGCQSAPNVADAPTWHVIFLMQPQGSRLHFIRLIYPHVVRVHLTWLMHPQGTFDMAGVPTSCQGAFDTADTSTGFPGTIHC